MASDSRRYIPPGSCTWCGHRPHPDTCASTITTKTTQTAPCPCTRHTWTPGGAP